MPTTLSMYVHRAIRKRSDECGIKHDEEPVCQADLSKTVFGKLK